MRAKIEAAEFPQQPGAYVVYETAHAGRPFYVGRGVTQTIEQGWKRNHLKDRAGGSALRRSTGPHLGLVDRKLSVSRDGCYYPPEVEAAITEGLLACYIEFYPAADSSLADTLEKRLISELDPVLNVRR